MRDDHPLAGQSSVAFAETLDSDHVGLHAASSINARTHLAAQQAGRALRLRIFGIADFLHNVNRIQVVSGSAHVKFRDMRPSKAELKQAFWPMVRGTLSRPVRSECP